MAMECMRNNFVSGALLNGGRYQTISALNHGSFGMVFMAQDLSINQPVAIKCLTKKSAPADVELDLAIDDKSEELDLHRSLGSHPNIVNLVDSFESEAHVYLVLEFCPQGDLYEAIRNGHGPLQTEHVRQFMLQLVDAVGYIHSQGIYHRDIKPENIFLAQDGSLKLGDFGLATTDKWSFEMMVGSDRYMAPEQFDSAGAGYSPGAADIWAIGICLLNILFSRNPFTTPTESDPLFLDFSRDKQSLFDVFPAMSQDAYEVIVQCMSLDSRKRSLVGAREALLRVVSFTTEDESLDDFCGGEKTAVASANREPLRTPSLQSPAVDHGVFPWAKALNADRQWQTRTLSVIADDESYSEDLFSRSQDTSDWCSSSIQTPSLFSAHDSPVDGPMRSLARRPLGKYALPSGGSLPISMAKPFVPSMSTIFGHGKAVVSKSWSDMWEEDEEELRQVQTKSRTELNSRTWSHESRYKTEPESASHNIKGDVDDDMVTDGFFFQDSRQAKKTSLPCAPRYSPPSKRLNYDKWAALGERRRGQKSMLCMDQSPGVASRRQAGIGYKSQEFGIFEHSCDNLTPHMMGSGKCWSKDRNKDYVWNKGRDGNWRRDRRVDLADVEWVGGW